MSAVSNSELLAERFFQILAVVGFDDRLNYYWIIFWGGILSGKKELALQLTNQNRQNMESRNSYEAGLKADSEAAKKRLSEAIMKDTGFSAEQAVAVNSADLVLFADNHPAPAPNALTLVSNEASFVKQAVFVDEAGKAGGFDHLSDAEKKAKLDEIRKTVNDLEQGSYKFLWEGVDAVCAEASARASSSRKRSRKSSSSSRKRSRKSSSSSSSS